MSWEEKLQKYRQEQQEKYNQPIQRRSSGDIKNPITRIQLQHEQDASSDESITPQNSPRSPRSPRSVDDNNSTQNPRSPRSNSQNNLQTSPSIRSPRFMISPRSRSQSAPILKTTNTTKTSKTSKTSEHCCFYCR